MKRFYRAVSVEDAGCGFTIALDGRPVKTPAKAAMELPTDALAAAVAAEWQAQGETIQPLSMPLTQLANTALDRVPEIRADIVAELTGYAATDLVCYRVETPADLKARQDAQWQPLVDWAATALDAPLKVTRGVLPVDQDDASVDAIGRAIERHDPFRMAALHLATAAAGSVVIGLALIAGEVDAARAFAAANVDELYQIETWGEDAEAQARLARVRADLDAAAAFAAALAGQAPPS